MSRLPLHWPGHEYHMVFYPSGKAARQAPDPPLCPRCGHPLIRRKGSKADVLVCASFPDCKEGWIQ